jgi:hypothetical protein
MNDKSFKPTVLLLVFLHFCDLIYKAKHARQARADGGR